MKLKLRYYFATLVVGLLLSVGAFAQSRSFNVKAVVKDGSSSENLSFVTVVIARPGADKPTAYALSGEDGSLLIEAIRPGKYILKAELLGYKTFETEFEVKDKDVDLGELKL